MLANLKITADDVQGELDRREHIEQRYKARTDLYWLLTDLLNRKDAIHPWLEARCREVQKSPDGHLDLWSRESYKSTIITFAKTIQDILCSHGDDPINSKEITIGIFSHTRPNSKGFLRQIKREFEGNERLKALFPDIFYENPSKEAVKWSEDDGIIVKRKGNPKEATIEAWGVVDGQPTGKHFDIQVFDDIVTAESVTNPDMIKKTTDMLVLAYNLGARGGKVRFIGTRYHFNDTYRDVISRGTAIPRIHTATVDGTVEGDPVLLTKEEIAKKRRDAGPYIFSCQFMQNPIADEVQGFKREWICYYDNVNWSTMNRIILMDPANAKKKSSDYSAGWVIALGQDQNVYILDIIRNRLNLRERTKVLMDWHRKFQPLRENGVRYEQYGMQADIEHIKSQQEAEGYRFDITEVGGSTPKNDRIKRLLPYFEQRRIYFPRSLYKTDYQGMTSDLVHTFIEEEYTSFPVPVHDDMLDSLARLLEPDIELIWPKQKIVADMASFDYSGFDNSEGWMA